MTTTVKPLPPHGSYARANGCPGYREPCNCKPCSNTRNRRKKQYRINSERGLPSRTDATPAREALNTLHQTMTWAQIAAATGTGVSNLQDIAAGRRTTTTRDTITKILAVQPQPASDPQKYVDATGTSRRLQALRALGYSLTALEALTGCGRHHLSLMTLGKRTTLRHHVASRITSVYDTLAQKPAPEGLAANVTRAYAASQQWAPPAAWDDIDDPTARPNWTGWCGTDRGWWLHRLEKIPGCQPCEEAHAAWKQAHAHLPRDERFAALGKAQAQARTREADLAYDARELMRVSGLNYEQAAERLRVTKQHLQQALLRHPEPANETAAAASELADETALAA
ncbi:hypothetical protein [Streptomyces sp. NPDC056817]|uniref:hypothetical protein n=1 Tax=Streptomyces sp. NPDC056817 TaxID=3345950 RepID=UPI0036853B40